MWHDFEIIKLTPQYLFIEATTAFCNLRSSTMSTFFKLCELYGARPEKILKTLDQVLRS